MNTDPSAWLVAQSPHKPPPREKTRQSGSRLATLWWLRGMASLPPHLVQLGFDYVLAVEAGDDSTASRLVPEVEWLPGLLAAIAEPVVFPVTVLSDDTEPCADFFVLDEVGVLYLMAIREWATHAPAAAAPGIARTIAHFVGQVLADAPTGVLRAVRALRDDRWSGPARWWRLWWLCTADRTTAPGGCAPVRWCAHAARTESIRCASTRWTVRTGAVGGAGVVRH